MSVMSEDANIASSLKIGCIRENIDEIVEKVLPKKRRVPIGMVKKDVTIIKDEIYDYVYSDLVAFTENDPAAQGSPDYVFNTSSTFQAVKCYRIANIIYRYENIPAEMRRDIAKKISEHAKHATAVEIEPTAKIGKRFIIDHGTGTVIGGDCMIGSDCYILNGVVLGVRKFGEALEFKEIVTNNILGRRHPKIGNRVRISAFAKILGPIVVGDDVFISPHCRITHDIPSNSNVLIVNQLQVCRGIEGSTCDPREIYGIVPEEGGIICIYGKGLRDSLVSLVEFLDEDIDKDIQKIGDIKIIIKERGDDMVKLQFLIKDEIENYKIKEKLKKMGMVIRKDEKEIIVTESIGLKRAIEYLMRTKVGA